jgi:CubicO group peptidase (beta-lactamase class C family)
MQKPQRTTIYILLFLCVPSIWAAETAEARPATTPSEKADAFLAGVVETNDPGLAVLVARNGKILFEKGYGLADREHDVSVTPQTTFRIGSISKQFTATAILKLQEEGKLSVKDKLSKYIPDFPRGNEVTLRHLLTHTSGIHNYTDEPDFLSRVTNATTTEAIIEEIKKYPYDFDPGTKWSYDNSGYLLLGYIVEKVSGQSYGDFLRENFFQPLGMTNTGVYRADLGLPHEALGYGWGTNGFERALNWDMSWTGGAGALYSTAEDLYRWNEGVFNGRTLDAASLKAAFTPVKKKVSRLNSGNGYGFGWFIGRDRGLRDISHSGGLQGFSSYLLRLPDAQFTAVVLVNANPFRTNDNPVLLASQMMDIFLADKLAPAPVVNTNVSPKSYDTLTGRYEAERGTLTISRRGAHLFLKSGDEREAEIFPESDTEFFLKETDIQITFVKDGSGKAVKLIFNDCGMEVVVSRVNVDPAVYDSLVGKYDYGESGVLAVTREGNHLFAQLADQPKCEIFPTSETEYYWKVADAQITFEKDAAGKVTKAIHHQNGHAIDAPRIP